MAKWPSPTYRLADVLLKGKLETLIREERAAGTSYETLSREIWLRTGKQVTVTKATVINWARNLGVDEDEEDVA